MLLARDQNLLGLINQYGGKYVRDGLFRDSLSSNLTADPLPLRARHVGIMESIHDDVDLVPYLGRLRLIRVLVEDEEDVHQVARASELVWLGQCVPFYRY